MVWFLFQIFKFQLIFVPGLKTTGTTETTFTYLYWNGQQTACGELIYLNNYIRSLNSEHAFQEGAILVPLRRRFRNVITRRQDLYNRSTVKLMQ